jgi:hypothetical protein
MNREADALANLAMDEAASGRGEIRNEKAGGAAPAAAAPAARKTGARIRARFERGVFVPTEKIDLDEGAEVTLEIRPK